MESVPLNELHVIGKISVKYADGDTGSFNVNKMKESYADIKLAPSAPTNVGKGDHRHNDVDELLKTYTDAEKFSIYDLPI